MLGTDKSRGYCLEMICADFLAGANLDNGNPEILLSSMTRFFKFLPGEQRQSVPVLPGSESFVTGMPPKRPRIRWIPARINNSADRSWRGTGGSVKSVALDETCRSTTNNSGVSRARIDDLNLITLCAGCHERLHRLR